MAPFRYSLNGSTLRPTPVMEKIRVAARAGYDGIELWHDDLDRALKHGATLTGLRKALDDHGLAVPTTIFLKGWWDPAAAGYAEAMDGIRRRLEQAAALGAPHVVASPPHGHPDYDRLAAEYAKLIDLGLSLGVRPAFEYLGFAEDVNSIEKALRVIRGSGHPEATIVLDPFHDFRGGAGHEAIAQLRPEQIAVSHFDDAPADPPRETQQDPDRVMPGDGVIDLPRYVALLRQIGYEGFISLELFREDLWKRDAMEVAKLGLQKMRAVCEA